MDVLAKGHLGGLRWGHSTGVLVQHVCDGTGGAPQDPLAALIQEAERLMSSRACWDTK